MADAEGESDEQLAKLAQSGDREAFTRLLHSYELPIYHLAYRLSGDAEEARDLTQEIFVRAYLRLSSYDPSRRFFPWLYRLGVNYCLNQQRQQRRQPTITLSRLGRAQSGEDEDVMFDLPDMAAGPEELSERAEQQAAVNAAISKLPTDYQAVIALRYGADLDYAAIAETLNLPLGTVKTRLFRAKESLRRELGKGEKLWRRLPAPYPLTSR